MLHHYLIGLRLADRNVRRGIVARQRLLLDCDRVGVEIDAGGHSSLDDVETASLQLLGLRDGVSNTGRRRLIVLSDVHLQTALRRHRNVNRGCVWAAGEWLLQVHAYVVASDVRMPGGSAMVRPMHGDGSLVFPLGRDGNAFLMSDEPRLPCVLAAEDRLDMVKCFDLHVAAFVSFEAYLLVEILGSRIHAARQLARESHSLLRLDHLSGAADRVLPGTLQRHLAREDAHGAVDDAEILH